jgi:hypothetical protein
MWKGGGAKVAISLRTKLKACALWPDLHARRKRAPALWCY